MSSMVVSKELADEMLDEINDTLEIRKSVAEGEDSISREILSDVIMRGRLSFKAFDRLFIYQLKYPLVDAGEPLTEISLGPLKVAQLTDLKKCKDDDIGRILYALSVSSGRPQRVLSELDTKDYAILSLLVQYFL